MAKSKNRQRKERVADGLCGFCTMERDHFDFLCDKCANAHRERQLKAVCPWCDGARMADKKIVCHACGGVGRVTKPQAMAICKEMGIVASG